MKRFVICLAMLLVFVGLSANVQAASVGSQFFGSVLNLISDDSGDYLVNVSGGVAVGGNDPGTDTTLDMGDFLITAFVINTVENPAAVKHFFGVGGVNELTGISALKVISKTGGGGTPATFAFGALSAADAATLATVSPSVGALVGGWTAGTTVALYDDPTPNFVRTSADDADPLLLSEDALAISTAADGTEILQLGFTGLPGEFWTASTLTDDISVIGTIPPPTAGGTFGFGINVVVNSTGFIYVPVGNFNTTAVGPYAFGPGTSQFSASGSLFGKTSGPYDSFDSFEATFAPVPEPSSLTLLLLGLVGLGGAGYRRRKDAA